MYVTDALVPATPWLRLSNVPSIAAPTATLRCDLNVDGRAAARCRIDVANASKTEGLLWAVWAKYGATWQFSVASSASTFLPEQLAGQALRQVVISRVDRYGVEGARSLLTRP